MSQTYHDAPPPTTGCLDGDDRSGWAAMPVADRCRIVASSRFEVAAVSQTLIEQCRSDQRRDDVETIASELIPLGDALAWIGRHGTQALADRRVGLSGRPVWLWGTRAVVRRVPLGKVLVLGAWNYPLLLPGVQTAQGLAAGNIVWLKPAPGCESATATLAECFYRAGVPTGALIQLPSDTAAAESAIAAGVDLVVLTGAASTGQKVLRQTAESLTPTIMELSGCDAVAILPGADLDRVARAVGFGLMFNSGATCIGPRRLFVPVGLTSELRQRLGQHLRSCGEVIVHASARQVVADLVQSAIDSGATSGLGEIDVERLRQLGETAPIVLTNVPDGHPILAADSFAPILSICPYAEVEEIVEKVNGCPYRLAASVFGPEDAALALANRLSVGSVTINDMIAPTADPRLPFGGRGRSGFGVTRGPEGLTAMTAAKVISIRRGRVMPHLSARKDSDAAILSAAMRLRNGRTIREKIAAFVQMAKAGQK